MPGTAPSRPSLPAATSPTRSLVPREHGAYGQLALPLATAFALGRPRAAALLLGAAVALAFFAHESLLVALGQRGERALQADAPRARRLLALLGGLALLAAAAGLALSPPLARAAFVGLALLSAVVGLLVHRRLEKTIAGEVAVGATLAWGALVVALAAGVTLASALACWVAWTFAFAIATLSVQVVLGRARSKGASDPGRGHAVASLALLAIACGLAAAGLPWAAPLALVPIASLSVAVCLSRFSPKRLRALGWTMLGTSVLTMVLLVATLG
jgi:hypothetical protein